MAYIRSYMLEHIIVDLMNKNAKYEYTPPHPPQGPHRSLTCWIVYIDPVHYLHGPVWFDGLLSGAVLLQFAISFFSSFVNFALRLCCTVELCTSRHASRYIFTFSGA